MNVLATGLVQKTLFSISVLSSGPKKYRYFIARGQQSAEARHFGGTLANPEFVFILFHIVDVTAKYVILTYIQKYLIYYLKSFL